MIYKYFFPFCGQNLHFLLASSVTIERSAFLIFGKHLPQPASGESLYDLLFSPSGPKFLDSILWHLCVLLHFYGSFSFWNSPPSSSGKYTWLGSMIISSFPFLVSIFSFILTSPGFIFENLSSISEVYIYCD